MHKATSKWDGKTGGIATSTGGYTIVYDTPKTYGGNEEGICPDEVFLASLVGCLNNTFLDFQRRFEMELVSIELNAKSTSKFGSEGYSITKIEIYGEVVVGEDELETGERCVELMKTYCHISSSIKDCIPFEYSITVREVES
jgi:uncharacterized OsmC-like protein